MTRRGEGKRTIKAKAMSVPITEEESERLQVACWLLDCGISTLMRKAVEAFLLQYQDQIDQAIRAKRFIKQSMPEATNENQNPATAESKSHAAVAQG